MKATYFFYTYLTAVTTIFCYSFNALNAGEKVPCASMLSQPVSPPSQTLADQKLLEIVEDQEVIFKTLEQTGNAPISPELERRVGILMNHYQSFVKDNPNHLYGRILFGKFLNKIDQSELAYEQFLKANDINPNIAVVKQQLGNSLAEKGQYALAIQYFENAIQLSPTTSVYYYQLGELLVTYRSLLIADKIYTPPCIDAKILNAFSNAAKNDEANRQFLMRQAEAYFDIEQPNWEEPLALWQSLYATAQSETEKEMIQLRIAEILIKLHRCKAALSLLKKPVRPALEQARQDLLKKAHNSSANTNPILDSSGL